MKQGGNWLSQYRVRLLVRGAFALLALATVAMAINVLQAEKQLSYSNYQASLGKTKAQIVAKLHHPTGQLALLNPSLDSAHLTPLRPLVLPFSAIDFDDRFKVQQAVEMAGCLVQYANHGAVCTAVGNNPWAGGFIYVAGSFASHNLVPKPPRSTDFSVAHRMQLSVALRGTTWHWIAPFEVTAANPTPLPPNRSGAHALVPAPRPAPVVQQGRLTGFAQTEDGQLISERPVRDFRGWIWQENLCLERANRATNTTASPSQATPDCLKRSFFSVRLPIALLRHDILNTPSSALVWPPADLAQTQVHVQVLAPGTTIPLFDSNAAGATPPFALRDLQALLLPGETLKIHKITPSNQPGGDGALDTNGRANNTSSSPTHLAVLTGTVVDEPSDYPALNQWVNRIIQKLPSASPDVLIAYQDRIATPLGDYQIELIGDVRSVNQALGLVATRIAWYVGAMLLAILLAAAIIEVSVIRRIAVLTRRANAVALSVQDMQQLGAFNLSDLRGHDELGILAGCISDLLQRVDDDIRRAQIRVAQEKDMWHAVGHEIMSPLQSLLALHGSSTSPSHRYISRMQQAIRVLYGSASPTEALQSSHLQQGSVELLQFLQLVAHNAPCAGIEQVVFSNQTSATAVWVRADEYSLEDAVTHVLRNAQRWRTPGSEIRLSLQIVDASAVLRIANQGSAIAPAYLESIFEYGVSNPAQAGAASATEMTEHRGQGLFVARTYMAKMGGTIAAENTPEGVVFVLTLALLAGKA